MILLFSRILTAKCWPDSMFLANLTFPKLPSPRVLPSSYFPSRIPCPCFCFSILFPSFTITITETLLSLKLTHTLPLQITQASANQVGISFFNTQITKIERTEKNEIRSEAKSLPS